ncbi:MAG: FtsK/SpoIIIE domain-containing protein, partial [Candidatus Roizmanbacteria bacterium]
GQLQVADISTTPHALVAGTTGSGKSVLLNSWVTTIMMRTTPEQVRLILVDPKRVELSVYNGAPHLLTEVIVDPKKIISALQWTVNEMDRRYRVLADMGTRNIVGYNVNKKPDADPMPYIVFIIDELADLMLFASSEVEDLITRIAQMARAVGIHLILATQRPSVDVITGLMKSNIPTRIAFNVPSLIDSRVMLDTQGAEKLLGKGDMLYLTGDSPKPRRIQAAFVSEKEVQDVVKFLKSAVPVVQYTDEVTEQEISFGKNGGNNLAGAGDRDPLFEQAAKVIYESQQASTSFLQRRMKVGYSRAARILDELEAAGYVGPAEKGKAREILRGIAAPQETS